MTKWTNRTLNIKFIRKDEEEGNLLLQTFHETERPRESDVSSSNPKSHQVTNIKRRGWRVYKVDHTLENLSGVKWNTLNVFFPYEKKLQVRVYQTKTKLTSTFGNNRNASQLNWYEKS